MSASSKINDSPSHFMVLEAIARGIDSIDKISNAVRKSKDEVSSLVNDLVTQRLAMVEKRRFFGGKKVKITITETGKNLLGIKYEELKQNKQKLQQLYDSGDKQQLQTYMDSSRMWMPFMLFSGIMNALFFTSMISFMGMTMNPSESAVVDSSGTSNDMSDSGGTDNQADSGTSGASDTTDTGTDTGDIGSDGGGFDGGGFGF